MNIVINKINIPTYIFKAVVLSAGLFLLSCQSKEALPSADKPVLDMPADDRIFISKEQFLTGKMSWVRVETLNFPVLVEANGLVGLPPQYKAEVSTVMGGILRNIYVNEGENVRKGQRLATIENHKVFDLQKEYAELHTQLSYLESELHRKKQLSDEKIIAKQDFLSAQNAYNMARTSRDGLLSELKALHLSPEKAIAGNISHEMPIHAPISGQIMKIEVVTGSSIPSSQALMSIIDKNHLRLELEVFEKDIAAIRRGQRILFRLPETTVEPQVATVQQIGTSLSSDRKVMVYAKLAKSRLPILDGMFVEAAIEVDSMSSPALPETALVQVQESYQGLVLDETTEAGFFLQPITLNVKDLYNNSYRLEQHPVKPYQFLGRGAFQLLGE